MSAGAGVGGQQGGEAIAAAVGREQQRGSRRQLFPAARGEPSALALSTSPVPAYAQQSRIVCSRRDTRSSSVLATCGWSEEARHRESRQRPGRGEARAAERGARAGQPVQRFRRRGALLLGRPGPPGAHLQRRVDRALAVQEEQAEGEAHEAGARLRQVSLAAQHERLHERLNWKERGGEGGEGTGQRGRCGRAGAACSASRQGPDERVHGACHGRHARAALGRACSIASTVSPFAVP